MISDAVLMPCTLVATNPVEVRARPLLSNNGYEYNITFCKTKWAGFLQPNFAINQ